MSITSNLKSKILEMPALNAGLAEAWLSGRPEAARWLFAEAVRRGWIRETGQATGEYEPVPWKKGGAYGAALSLTTAQVVDVVASGHTKAADIVEVARARHSVERRTVMKRLAEAVAEGLLVRTVPAGSYALAKPESID